MNIFIITNINFHLKKMFLFIFFTSLTSTSLNAQEEINANEETCTNWNLQQKELSKEDLFDINLSTYWVKERSYNAENKFDPRNGELFLHFMLFITKTPRVYFHKSILQFKTKEQILLNSPDRITSLNANEMKLIIKNIFQSNKDFFNTSTLKTIMSEDSLLELFIEESHLTFLNWLTHLPYVYGGSSIHYFNYFWECSNDTSIKRDISTDSNSFFYLKTRNRKISDKISEQIRIENLLKDFQPFFNFLIENLSPQSNLHKKISFFLKI